MASERQQVDRCGAWMDRGAELSHDNVRIIAEIYIRLDIQVIVQTLVQWALPLHSPGWPFLSLLTDSWPVRCVCGRAWPEADPPVSMSEKRPSRSHPHSFHSAVISPSSWFTSLVAAPQTPLKQLVCISDVAHFLASKPGNLWGADMTQNANGVNPHQLMVHYAIHVTSKHLLAFLHL